MALCDVKRVFYAIQSEWGKILILMFFPTGNMERNFQLFRKKQFDENIICWSFNFSQFSTI